jgi:type II secretion system protein J
MRPRRRARGAGSPGFTLVEVLLTLLIMSGIMITITQVLAGVRRTRDEIHNIQERHLAGPAILGRIERDLRSLLTYNRQRRYALRVKDRVMAGLDADSLDFVCTVNGLLPWQDNVSDPFRRADVNEVGYRLRERPDSDDFLEIFRREDFGVDDEPFEGGRFAFLHDRVKAFNIEVFEEDGPDVEPVESWSWEDNPDYVGLPARIELELTLELAPRLVREQLVIDRRTIVYRRIIRFPQNQREAIQRAVRPVFPVIEPPTPDTPGTPGPGTPPGPQVPDPATPPPDPFG